MATTSQSNREGNRKRGGVLGRLTGFVDSYEHRATSLLVLVLMIDFADRTLIGALGPTLESVFHIGNFELGVLATVFVVVAAPATLGFGIFTDRWNRTLLLALSLVIWVIGEGLTGAAISFGMLIGVRILLGVVSAASGPTTPSLIGDLVPATERSRALSSIDAGSLIGDGVGFVLPAIILGFASWRWNFWVLAAFGALLAVAFWLLPEPQRVGAEGPQEAKPEGEESPEPAYEMPLTEVQQMVQRRQITPRQRSMVRRDAEDASLWYAMKYTLRVRTDLISLIARSLGDFFFQAIAIFAVLFATRWYGLGQRTADLMILVIGIGAFIGILVMGRVSDYMLKKREWLSSRVWLGAVSYIISPIPLFFAFLTHSLYVAIPLFFVGAFFLGAAEPPLDALRVDVLVPRLRGRAESVRQFFRSIVEGAAPVVLGGLSVFFAAGTHNGRGLQLSFLVLLPLVLLAGLLMLLAIPTYAPDVAAALKSSEIQDEIEEQQEEQEGQQDHPKNNLPGTDNASQSAGRRPVGHR